MLGLQVHAPFYRELELHIRALKHRDRLAIIHAHEFRTDDALELGT